ncbi:universal stress protein [Estrella lausannensis]|uniref:Universal stress protein n=1 Tax=Estrella lausannensis TaxID=483423 RepID=A0A0H5DQS5_9BACT|nr:universal stress protein [Estrella lausannensis]CRX39011.1 Putative universal stress protein A [Estrella lausannensis]
MYKSILLAADLIDQDDNPALEKAKAIRESTGADLHVVHAIELPSSYGTTYEMPIIAEWQDDLEASARKRLEKLGETLGINATKLHLKIGQPKYEILEVAKECSADLIIVGSHGRHGIGLLLLGSTANAVLHGAQCDVLAVRV